jgi:7 transmembrane receptor (rhodopsin family).
MSKSLIAGAFLFVFSEVSNVLLLIALLRVKKPFNTTKKLYIYLTCIDIVLLLAFAPSYMHQYLNNLPFILQTAFLLAQNFTQILDMLTFCTISFMRYWSLHRPFLPIRTRMAYGILGVELAFAVVLDVGIVLPSLILPFDVYIKPAQVITVSIIAITLLFIVIVNTLSYVRLRKPRRRKKKNETVNELEIGGMTESDHRKREAVKTLMLITFFYVVCTLPVLVSIYINTSTKEEKYKNDVIIFISVWTSNSGINAVIYLLRTKDLRQYYTRSVTNVAV